MGSIGDVFNDHYLSVGVDLLYLISELVDHGVAFIDLILKSHSRNCRDTDGDCWAVLRHIRADLAG